MGTEHLPSFYSPLYLTPIILSVALANDFYLEIYVKSLAQKKVSIQHHCIFYSDLITLQIEIHIVAAESGVYLVC